MEQDKVLPERASLFQEVATLPHILTVAQAELVPAAVLVVQQKPAMALVMQVLPLAAAVVVQEMGVQVHRQEVQVPAAK